LVTPETGISNSIAPGELFTGDNPNISKGYSPMVVRFFMLQSHYRSTLDLTDAALTAAEKGYRRLMDAHKILQNLSHPGKGNAGALDKEIKELIQSAHNDMSDDFNAPKALARLFELVTKINGLKAGHLAFDQITSETLNQLKTTFTTFIFDIFGLLDDTLAGGGDGEYETLDGLISRYAESFKNSVERWKRWDGLVEGIKLAVLLMMNDEFDK